MTTAIALDAARLAELAAVHAEAYRSAWPFPHAVIDDFLPQEVIEPVLDEFPAPGEPAWSRRAIPTEVKLQTNAEHGLGPGTVDLLHRFNSAPMLEFLEALTGITGLIPDPHLLGGGLHQIERGGYLKVHADFNRHDRLRLDRRLNLLLYLNEDWPEEYGGHLELWDEAMTSCGQRILPVLNRCVVFTTTSTSYHGHPEPLTCPPGRTRRSMALYYYTAGRPPEEARPRHTTRFQHRPGEDWVPRRSGLERLARWVPPAVADAVRRRR